MFDLAQLQRAQQVVHAAMPPTPAHAWPLLSERLGATAIVKHENHTPIGAFKVRGGLVYLDRLTRERPHTRGLVSATRGNHGQSLAFAASRYRMPVTIYVPQGNSTEKNRAMRAFGADLVEFGEDFQVAREEAGRHASRDGLELVPSFHPDLVMGSRPMRSNCSAPRRTSISSMSRSGRDPVSAAASWRAICSAFPPRSSACSRRWRRPMRCRSLPARW